MKHKFLHCLLPCLLFVCSLPVQAQIITTYAGTGVIGSWGDGGPATLAWIYRPGGIAVDYAGNVYFSDSGFIQKIDTGGIINIFAGTGIVIYSGDGGPATAAGISYGYFASDSAGNIYLTATDSNRIRKIGAAGIINTFAGTGMDGHSGDGGPASVATLAGPGGIAIDQEGNIYFADSFFIRKISSGGIITTIAGNGIPGNSGDGGPATAAEIKPTGNIAVDNAGNIYFDDFADFIIRKISVSGIITLFAGTGSLGYSGDGGPATAAQLGQINGLATDSSRNLYISDYASNIIRKVNSLGIISTVAGNGTEGFSGDGGPAIAAELARPEEIAIAKSGDIFIADLVNNRIRKITQPAITIASSSADAICAGTAVTFTATVTNDGSVPGYQWQLNHINVGTDTAAYVTDTLHNGDVVTCTLSYTFGDTVTTTSNAITITVDSLPPHAGPIAGTDTVCIGMGADTLTDSVAGGIWRASNTHASVAGGVVAGITTGADTIIYKVTNGCGSDSAEHTIISAICPNGVAAMPGNLPTALSIYPNPNDGSFTLTLPGNNEPAHIIITNMVGEKIKDIPIAIGTIPMQLDVPAGVYFLSVVTGEGRWNGKVVVAK